MASSKVYLTAGMIRTDVEGSGSTLLYICAGLSRQVVPPSPGGVIMAQLQKNNLGADLFNGSLI